MQYTKNNPLRVCTLCSGYDSQCLALNRLREAYPDFDYQTIITEADRIYKERYPNRK